MLRSRDVPVILLDVLPETIMKRLSNDTNRPLARKLGVSGLITLKGERDDRYEQVSDFRIATDDLTPLEVVAAVINKLVVEH
nr:shikimate kinase [Lentilactobacillus kisonensis]